MMVWKLLKKNISLWQIGGYAVATLAGLVVVLVAMQFYRDVAGERRGPDGGGIALASARNIVISKPVGLQNTFGGNAPTFSADDIEDIESQPWCGGVSAFRASDFGVWAGIELGGRTLQTALFFESVPDSLIDIDPAEWTFDPASPSVPIIIAKDYLTLYNFGFAASGRMPPVSEAMLSSIPLSVTLSGRGDRIRLPGRIVGYSSWLNTVAVPERFMDWAHARFGSGSAERPSRLVIEVSDAADPNVSRFLASRGYEQAGPDNDTGRTAYLLKLLTGVVAGIGIVITLLALGILVLSLFLLVQKNRRVIDGLLLLGYTPRAVAACYQRLVAVVNACVLAGACGLLLWVRTLWAGRLAAIDIASASPWPTVGAALGIMLVITALNLLLIRRLIYR